MTGKLDEKTKKEITSNHKNSIILSRKVCGVFKSNINLCGSTEYIKIKCDSNGGIVLSDKKK